MESWGQTPNDVTFDQQFPSLSDDDDDDKVHGGQHSSKPRGVLCQMISHSRICLFGVTAKILAAQQRREAQQNIRRYGVSRGVALSTDDSRDKRGTDSRIPWGGAAGNVVYGIL
jgi:hypothetical protein